MSNIFAYTDHNSPYPGFVSVNLKQTGGLVLTVREAVEGKQLINFDFPDDQVERIITNFGMYMTSKMPSRSEEQRQNLIDQEVKSRIEAGEGIPHEMAVLCSAMKQDPDYLWSWHCNLVMAFVDAGGDRKTAMQGSARFIYNLTQIDVTEHPNYKQDLEQLNQN